MPHDNIPKSDNLPPLRLVPTESTPVRIPPYLHRPFRIYRLAGKPEVDMTLRRGGGGPYIYLHSRIEGGVGILVLSRATRPYKEGRCFKLAGITGEEATALSNYFFALAREIKKAQV